VEIVAAGVYQDDAIPHTSLVRGHDPIELVPEQRGFPEAGHADV